jgi:hypothetical protein
MAGLGAVVLKPTDFDPRASTPLSITARRALKGVDHRIGTALTATRDTRSAWSRVERSVEHDVKTWAVPDDWSDSADLVAGKELRPTITRIYDD